MQLKMYHKGRVLVSEVRVADTFFKRLKGWMLLKKPPQHVLWIKPCASIHTFFMNFPIDVLFLDEDLVVVDKKTSIKKNSIAKPVRKSKYVIEGSENLFSDIKVGDVISIC